MTPRVTDDDGDTITITLDGKEIRSWSYGNDAERRTKMLAAREFVEGWYQKPAPAIDATIAKARGAAKAYRLMNWKVSAQIVAELLETIASELEASK